MRKAIEITCIVALGVLLADDIAIQFGHDFTWGEVHHLNRRAHFFGVRFQHPPHPDMPLDGRVVQFCRPDQELLER